MVGSTAAITRIELPTIYARSVPTVIVTGKLDGVNITESLDVLNLSPGSPVAPLKPVSPVKPVAPCGPSIPSRFTFQVCALEKSP